MRGGHTQVFPESGAHASGGHAGSGHPSGRHPGGAAFPDSGDVRGAGAFPANGIPRGGRAARTEADGTAVLPRARNDRRAADFRRAPERDAARAADPEQTTVLRRVRAGGPAGPGTAEPPSDPWTEPFPTIPTQPTAADPTHDPHEVTVQMDAVQLGDGRLTPVPGSAHGTGRETADGPVFVDESGRRSRTFRRLGLIVGLACAVYAVIIVATLFSGSSDAPWTPVPQNEDKPAGQVNSSPVPAESAEPSATASASPSAGTGASQGTTPAPSASAPAPAAGSATGAARVDSSAGSRPTTTGPTSGTSGTGGGTASGAPPSTSAGGTQTAPSSPSGAPESPVEGTAGAGAAAGQPAPQSLSLAEKPIPGASHLTPSPEHNL
ncbi:hypothetical protein [Streptomyces cellostaticus]|uniref:hypothetical protein n=1 Tax=Streptomyces cellostaticus TaxID=67285 RepID=UPI002025EC20|nr:hypothetical protein [Streptomyces cellostaticus]